MKSAGADGHVGHTLGQTPVNQEELWPQGTQGNDTGPTEPGEEWTSVGEADWELREAPWAESFHPGQGKEPEGC